MEKSSRLHLYKGDKYKKSGWFTLVETAIFLVIFTFVRKNRLIFFNRIFFYLGGVAPVYNPSTWEAG